MSRPLLVPMIVVALTVGCTGEQKRTQRGPSADAKPSSSETKLCDLPREIVQRVARGYARGRSGDVVMIEAAPNQLGTIHSTPWPFTQRVPMILYGPGHIESGVTSARSVTMADVAPTLARLLDFEEFPRRDGEPFHEALVETTSEPPRLIVTVVWDGAGTNVLRRWPDAWPYLKRLARRGTSFSRATVGSSPSVTPAVHATLGTGSFPAAHAIPDVKVRAGSRVVDPWEAGSPRLLRQRTLADLWDEANEDEAEIGVMAHDFWHVGMIGHGSQHGGDRDVAVLDDLETATEFTTNDGFYRLPEYVLGVPELDEAIQEVDRMDGSADGYWLGNPLNALDGAIRGTPAWPIVQTDKIMQILEREGFGADEVTDLFFTNYKSTDLAGHAWNMEEPEVRDVLRQQDRELRRLVEGLDALVGPRGYVLLLTSDHGMAPYPEVRGGWPINITEITKDIEAAFGKVVLSNRGFQVILDRKTLKREGHSIGDVASFLRNYTVADNTTSTSAGKPDGVQDNDRVFLTALTPDELAAAAQCGS